MSDVRPRPKPIPTTQPFWDGLAAETVTLQHCADCGVWVYYPRRRCPGCLSDRLVWEVVSGRGRVYSWTVARQATHPAFEAEVPQILAVVELAEGVRLTTSLVGVEPDGVAVGDEVEPHFDHGADGVTLLRYRPVQ
ncbi:MAG: Zn-ribbon domain-containing OB-fold protein [Acidimicrobiales bacterium]